MSVQMLISKAFFESEHYIDNTESVISHIKRLYQNFLRLAPQMNIELKFKPKLSTTKNILTIFLLKITNTRFKTNIKTNKKVEN